MANDYVQVVNRLGETMEGRLDSKLDVKNAHGSMFEENHHVYS